MTATSARRRLARRLAGRGIEIGALDRPTQLPPGATVVYADVLPPDVVARDHPGAPVPSIRCDGELLPGVVDSAFDFLVANHVLEHLSNPLGALGEWHRVVRDGGLVLLAVPDKRYTFDAPRRRTRLAHLLDDARSPLPPRLRDLDHLLDWATHVERLPRSSPEWGHFVLEQLERGYSVHNHVWVARDLLRVLRHPAVTGRAPLALVRLSGTGLRGDEFVFLLRVRKAPDRSRRALDLARILLAEARTWLEEPFHLALSTAKRIYRGRRPRPGAGAPPEAAPRT